MASPSSVLTRGLGSWADVNLLITHGFGIGTVIAPPDIRILSITDERRGFLSMTDAARFLVTVSDTGR